MEAVFYTKSNGSQFPHPYDIKVLRDSILERITPERLLDRRVFISRRNTKARKFDENIYKPVLEKHNIEVVLLEKLALIDQIKLMSQASFVTGMHGAGFTHCIFGRKDLKVLELFDRHNLNDCYARINLMLNNKYRASLNHNENLDESIRELI